MMSAKKLYGTATVGTKGQVVIPADARLQMGIEASDRLSVIGPQKGKWVGVIQEELLLEMLDPLTDTGKQYNNLLNTHQINKGEPVTWTTT